MSAPCNSHPRSHTASRIKGTMRLSVQCIISHIHIDVAIDCGVYAFSEDL